MVPTGGRGKIRKEEEIHKTSYQSIPNIRFLVNKPVQIKRRPYQLPNSTQRRSESTSCPRSHEGGIKVTDHTHTHTSCLMMTPHHIPRRYYHHHGHDQGGEPAMPCQTRPFVVSWPNGPGSLGDRPGGSPRYSWYWASDDSGCLSRRRRGPDPARRNSHRLQRCRSRGGRG